MSDAPIPLPELFQGDLSPAQVQRLFSDLESFAEIDGISVKGGPQAYTTGEHTTLAEAAALVQARTVAGVQIRYQYAGQAWFDTLMLRGDATRVVRIKAP